MKYIINKSLSKGVILFNFFNFSLFKKTIFFTFLSLMVFSCWPSGNESRHINRSTNYFSDYQSVNFDLQKIKERGSLVAIVDNSSTNYFIYKGKTMGYEYELLSKLAKELGVHLKVIVVQDIEVAIEKLNSGEGDILAHRLAVTKDLAEKMTFTTEYDQSRQVLVQRTPGVINKTNEELIRNSLDLHGKEVHVRKGTPYQSRLKNLSEEIGGGILVIEESGEIETESLIQKVAIGEIDYTVADESVAKVNKIYYPYLDIKTHISFPQKIAWGVRKNSPELLEAVNTWLKKTRKTNEFHVIRHKYFDSPRASLSRRKSYYSSLGGKRISPYDELFKKAAEKTRWDWKLLAAIAYQESRFDPSAEAWTSASGLMQLIPETGKRFGATDLFDPVENIKAASNYLRYLDRILTQRLPDNEERLKFVLASYNVGLGHVLDARRLAEKYEKDPTKWDDVAIFLLGKSEPHYFNDPVVKSGYCRGSEPVKYVTEVLSRLDNYNQLYSNQPVLASR